MNQPVELPFAQAQRNAISQPLPQYPEIAKQAGVSGSVHFKFNINEAGHVMNLELVSGHPLLIPNSSDTIQNWSYRPFKFLSEQPREIRTRIALRFDSEKGQVSLVAPPSLGENLNVGKEAPMTGTSEPYHVTSEVLGQHNRKVKWPPYPDGPLKEFQGTVRLNVIIAKSGRVTKVSATVRAS